MPLHGECATLLEILRWRAVHQADRRAYTFLVDGESEERSLTYRELDTKARTIGALLQRLDVRGQRALLVYPSGLDYLCAFFGGLYAGAIDVPAYPPGHHALEDRYLQRLDAIAKDARPRVALTTAKIFAVIEPLLAQLPALRSLQWIPTDELASDDPEWSDPRIGASELAFLQYTSGSTSSPKGVMVSHGNLMANAEMYQRVFELSEATVIVNWMPLFHDFGLIGHVLQALYLGVPCILLEPAAFMQKPLRWLQAITRYRGTLSAAPNFAYELCIRKITEAQRRTLDLGCWKLAINAAEPVRAATIDRFAEAFAPCGFRLGASTPGYGLAEVTLVAAGGVELYPHTTRCFKRSELEQGRVVETTADDPDAKRIVGCGHAPPGQALVIADPQTRATCPSDREGEIWVAGPHVAGGYWERPEATEDTFRAHLGDTGAGPFLRTGDLGFVSDGNLYITGRHKDMIIIRGSNHHPQDIELTAERAHPALRPGNGVAFGLELEGEERLALVWEVERGFRGSDEVVAEIVGAIRQALAEAHGLDVHAIVLIETGSICKTTSGKLQRRACRAAFLQHELRVVGQWREAVAVAHAQGVEGRPSASFAGIQAWLVTKLAAALGLGPDEIHVEAPFARHGLNSLAAVGLTGELAEWLGRSLAPTLLYEYPSIASLSRYLAGESASPSPARAEESPPGEPIAVIGMMCRFPGRASDPEAFWQLLRTGGDAITEVPPQRWDPETTSARHGGFLEAVDRFDAAFFGITPREAMTMDPQQRLLLEVSWEALERSGQAPEALVGSRTGVFVGIGSHDYETLAGGLMATDAYVGTGTLVSAAAGRISYVLGLQGPTLAVDTACSSSLVSVHLACRSLRVGECDLALAGGVQLILAPDTTRYLWGIQALSPDGRCKTFDAGANGYVRGEGCGVVVLKRLSEAVRDRDPILAVIRGSAVNHDGRSNGLTAPNGRSQEALLRQALLDARLEPEDVDYVEAHGTGTALGDPIEVRALGAVLGAGRPLERPLALGSVKTNLGHLEAAAGVAGLIKAVLALQHGEIPPHLHLAEKNPYIPWAELAVVVPIEPTPWPAQGKRRIAGVSSFGVSGTNAHVIVEEAPPLAAASVSAEPERMELLPLSARSPAALRAVMEAHRAWLTASSSAEDCDVQAIAYTASVRRAHHEHRMAVVGRSVQEWARALEAALEQPQVGAVQAAARPRLVLVFPGHGSQWVGMGRQLLAEEPVFRSAIAACDAATRREAGWSVLEALLADDGAVGQGRLDVIQPLIFAMEVAIAALWRSWGVVPDAVVGHSFGELAAAHVAGALRLEQAVRIVCRRSELLMRIKGRGVMALVELPFEAAEQAIDGREDRLSAAVSNSPGSTVLSGALEAMEEVLGQLKGRGVACRRLEWAVAAGHSPHVDVLLPELRAALTGLRPEPARIPMYSTVTAKELGALPLDTEYWLRNLRAPVKFSQAIRCVQDDQLDSFLEVSPHPILVPAIEATLGHGTRRGVVVPSLRRNQDERRSLLESLAALYGRGCAPDWRRLHPAGGRCVGLPGYPWQRKRYWFDEVAPETATGRHRRGLAATEGHPLLGSALTSSVETCWHFWEQQLAVDALPYLSDHRVDGEVVFPGAGYIEIALGIAAEVYGPGAHVVSELAFEHALALPAAEARTVQAVLVEDGPARASLRISSREGAGWVRHATASVQRAEREAHSLQAASVPRQIQERCVAHWSGTECYEQLKARGAAYGPAFQGVAELWLGTDEALGRVRVPEAVAARTSAYHFHPGFLDSCLQVMMGLVPAPPQGHAAILLPTRVSRLCLHAAPGQEVWVHAQRRAPAHAEEEAITADLVIMDDAGKLVAEVSGLRAQPLEPGSGTRREAQAGWLYARLWQRQALPPSPSPAKGTWVVLADRGKTGHALAALLRSRGHRCVQVMAGSHYALIEPELHQVDPRDPRAFHALLEAELGAEPSCLGVVHLWSLDVTEAVDTTHETLAADQPLGCLGALHLARALIEARWKQVPRLQLVTRGARSTGDRGPGVAVGQAPLWGLGRVLGLEHPELRCRCVDLDPAGSELEAEALLDELVRDDREDQVALREQGRHVARLVKTSFAARADAAAPGGADIRPDGSYLVTGGLGGLGLGLARWLVERGARHLVLVGRSSPSIEAQASIAAMEQAGAQVIIARVDVSRAEELRALLSDLPARVPPLRGIIHAAAVLDDGMIADLDADRFLRVMAPKLLGAWNLHALTLDQPLDFFVLYSSAALLLGSAGQASYVAGNAFLEALAQHRWCLGRCAMSIDWGPFSEVGGAARADRAERLTARGLASLTPAQGHEVLSRLLRRSRAQIGVMSLDLAEWIEFHPHEAGSPYLSELVAGSGEAPVGAGEAAAFTRRLQAASPEERLALLERHLVEQSSRVLRLDAADIDLDTAWTSLGLDSLMNLELRNRLAASLGVRLSAALFFAHPTVSTLAARLAEQLEAQGEPGIATGGPDDFQLDAALDPAIQPPPSRPGLEHARGCVLLTGATGFLGRFLLHELLHRTTLEVACLVRASDEAEGHARLREALARHGLWRPEYLPRIVPILGDLGQPLLGASAAGFDALADSVDAIYHCGAIVDWHESYEGLRAVNVMGTQELLRLCARGRSKPLHHVSTIGTLAPLVAEGGTLEELDAPDWQSLELGLHGTGYVQSKWVAEKKLLQARARGLPVAIYRPGAITGDSRSGAWVEPDYFYALIKGCIELGLAPAWNASVTMSAVDWVAQAIVELSRQPDCHGQTFHVLGQLGRSAAPELGFAELWAYIERRGYRLEVVPQPVFHRALAQAVAAGRSNALRTYVHHLRTESFPASRKLEYACHNTRALLQQADPTPCSAEELLDTYFDQLERSGFLERRRAYA